VLTVVIKANGDLERVEVNRSSGQSLLDDAARRIVQMAAPYAAFPKPSGAIPTCSKSRAPGPSPTPIGCARMRARFY
jgi:hypothetical protein